MEIELKGLSIRQPWIDMIVAGAKTMEVREWQLKFRGTIVLHASQAIDHSAAYFYRYQHPHELPTGKILATASVSDVIALDESNFENYRLQHFQPFPISGSLFGIVLREVKILKKPIPYRGSLGLFPIDESTAKRIVDDIGA